MQNLQYDILANQLVKANEKLPTANKVLKCVTDKYGRIVLVQLSKTHEIYHADIHKIAEDLDLDQSSFQKKLTELEKLDFVVGTLKGPSKYFSLNVQKICEFLEIMTKSIGDKGELVDEIKNGFIVKSLINSTTKECFFDFDLCSLGYKYTSCLASYLKMSLIKKLVKKDIMDDKQLISKNIIQSTLNRNLNQLAKYKIVTRKRVGKSMTNTLNIETLNTVFSLIDNISYLNYDKKPVEGRRLVPKRAKYYPPKTI